MRVSGERHSDAFLIPITQVKSEPPYLCSSIAGLSHEIFLAIIIDESSVDDQRALVRSLVRTIRRCMRIWCDPDRRQRRRYSHSACPRVRRMMASMTAITSEQARSYLNRWKLVREIETLELRNASLEVKARQLVVLMASRGLFGEDPQREKEIAVVRQRWARIREALSG